MAVENINVDSIDFSSTEDVVKKLSNLFKIQGTPSPTLPTPLVLASSAKLGVSPTEVASNIISRQEEAGIPVGALPDGTTSPDEIMYKIIVEEIINALIGNMRVTVAIQPGIPVVAVGANAAGPVVCQGTTIGIGQGNGVLQ